jgi:hypothetical protein
MVNESQDELVKEQGLWDLAQLPYRVFSPLLRAPQRPQNDFEHQDPIGTEAGGSRVARAVKSQAYKDRLGKAMQQLMSNGRATNDARTYSIMQAMHPKRKGRLTRQPTDKVNQVSFDAKTARQFLHSMSSKDQSCIGAFGWSGNMLIPLRGPRKMSPQNVFFQQLSAFIADIASARCPESFGFILTCGGIFALHKLPPEEQRERELKQLDPKLRPVNVGVCFLKWAFKLAVTDDAVVTAICGLQPVQQGLSAKRGVEVVAHLFRALYEKGYLICTTDYSNGFNAFMRQAMLCAVNSECPALNSLFNTFYALDSVCLFKLDEDFKVIWSTEGSRMGCVLGSLGFDLTVKAIYKFVADAYPGVVTKALTDDFTLAIPPPRVSGVSLADTYKQVKSIFLEVAKKSKEIAGLELNFSKCHLLVPEGLDPPMKADMPKGTSIELDGLRLAGAPLGTDQFCKDYMLARVNEVTKKLDALERIDPQVAFSMLRLGVVPALGFFFQVTPPHLTAHAARLYDERLLERAVALLTPTDKPAPQAGPEILMRRARAKLQLPIRHNGAGLTSAALIAPLAFLASVVSSVDADPVDLAVHKSGLGRFMQYTHEAVRNALGGEPSQDNLAAQPKFPFEDFRAILDSDFYEKLFEVKNLKLQRELSIVAHSLAAKRHLASFKRGKGSEVRSDFVTAHSQGQPSKTLQYPCQFEPTASSQSPSSTGRGPGLG